MMTPIKPDGTKARNIALHFVERTSGRATPAIMKKAVNQAKSLLKSGYTEGEVKTTIDYLVDVKNIEMYSLGYVNACINDVLKAIEKDIQVAKEKEQKEEIKRNLTSYQKESEVTHDEHSTKRNQDKSNRFGTKPRLGEKYSSDLFKE